MSREPADRFRILWPLLTAVGIGLPVLYVASFGPACWLVANGAMSCETASIIYRPLAEAAYSGPKWQHKPLMWWAKRFGVESDILIAVLMMSLDYSSDSAVGCGMPRP